MNRVASLVLLKYEIELIYIKTIGKILIAKEV